MTTRPATGIPALEEGLRLHARGWNVLPLQGKRPHPEALKTVFGTSEWRSLCDRRASVPDLERCWQAAPDAGLGLIVPEGVAVVDVDAPELFRHEHPATPMVATSRGRHMYFTGHVDGVHRFPWGEVRGAGPVVVVLPPSRHPDTGAEYFWLIGLDDVEMAPLPASITSKLNHREQARLTSTIGTKGNDGAEPNLSADASAVSRAFAYLGRPRALNPQTGRATTFRCVLAGHEDRRPSATIFRSKQSGKWRYVCRGCGAWLSLARVFYSCATGQDERANELPAPAAAMWLRRLWHDCGVAPVELLDMPVPDGPRDVRQVAEGFRLLASVRVSLGDLDPVPFSAAFAAGWSGVPLEVARAALKELRKQGWLRPLGKSRPGVGFLYELPSSDDAAGVGSAEVVVGISDARARPVEPTAVGVVKPQDHLRDFGAVLAAQVITHHGRVIAPVRRASVDVSKWLRAPVAHTADFTVDCGAATDVNEAA